MSEMYEQAYIEAEAVDVEYSKVEAWHDSSKNDHKGNARPKEGPISVGIMATNGLDQHSDISLEEDANVHSDQGKQLESCLAASWVQQGREPETILPAPVSWHRRCLRIEVY